MHLKLRKFTLAGILVSSVAMAQGQAAPGRSQGGLLVVMVLASIVLGVGAGFVAYIVSR